MDDGRFADAARPLGGAAPGTGPPPAVKLPGGHRVVPPTATVARVTPHLAALGVTRAADLTGLDRLGLPVVAVYRPNARSVAVALGKGATFDAALASGLMEAAEVAHAEAPDRPLRHARAAEMRAKRRVIDLAGLARPTRARDPETTPLLWAEAAELLTGGPIWLPYETVHVDFTTPRPPGSGRFAASTNGLASGNHPAEAVAHALCEVIERDAAARWRRLPANRRRRTRLDPASVADPACAALLAGFAAAGFAVALWETTSAVKVAAFHALIRDDEDPDGPPGAGHGCHPSRATALARALHEAAQVRLTHIAGARDDLGAGDYARGAREAKRRAVAGLMAEGPGARAFAEAPDAVFPTVDEDVRHLLACLRAAGAREVAALDLTRPEFGLPVVRVVVPGLLSDGG